MKISDEQRLDMIKFFYCNGSSWTATRRALQKKYVEKARNIHIKTIQRQVTKCEHDLTLRRQNTADGKKQLSTRKMSIKWDKCLMKVHGVQSETLRLLRERNYQRLLFGGFCEKELIASIHN
jgi:hypothetical protein